MAGRKVLASDAPKWAPSDVVAAVVRARETDVGLRTGRLDVPFLAESIRASQVYALDLGGDIGVDGELPVPGVVAEHRTHEQHRCGGGPRLRVAGGRVRHRYPAEGPV